MPARMSELVGLLLLLARKALPCVDPLTLCRAREPLNCVLSDFQVLLPISMVHVYLEPGFRFFLVPVEPSISALAQRLAGPFRKIEEF